MGPLRDPVRHNVSLCHRLKTRLYGASLGLLPLQKITECPGCVGIAIKANSSVSLHQHAHADETLLRRCCYYPKEEMDCIAKLPRPSLYTIHSIGRAPRLVCGELTRMLALTSQLHFHLAPVPVGRVYAATSAMLYPLLPPSSHGTFCLQSH